MGPAGAGSVAQVVNAAIGNRARFDSMRTFFEGVGVQGSAGIWNHTPEDDAPFRKRYAARLARQQQPIGELG
jgi:chlorophyllide a reductase subunit Y